MSDLRKTKAQLAEELRRSCNHIRKLERAKRAGEQLADELRATNEQLQHLLARTSVAIYSAKPSGDYGTTSITDNVRNITGYAPHEFTQSSRFWIDHVHPHDRQHIRNAVQSLVDHGIHAYEYRFLHKDGSYRWIRDEMRLVETDAEATPQIVGYFIDITQQKDAEEALRASEQRYHTLFDRLPIGLYRSTPAGRLIAANPTLARMLGYSDPASLMQVDVRSLYVEAGERERLLNRIDQSGSALSLEYQLQRRDGVRIWVNESAQAIRDATGAVRYYEGVLQDITDRKLAEQALRQERDFKTSLLQASPTFFVGISAAGRTLMMNQTMLQSLGYTEEEALGTDYLETFVPEADRELLSRVFDTLVRSREATLNANRVLTRDGRELLVEWHGRPVFKDNGEVDFFFGVGIDITERRSAEEEKVRIQTQLQHSHRMQAVARLAAGIAHDFNSILTIILASAEHVLGRPREGQTESADAAGLREIGDAVARGAALVRRLLAFGRVSKGTPQVLDLNQIVIGLERMLRIAVDEHVRLEVILASELGPICVDPVQMEEAIMNLVLNARDATPKGGTITIETAKVALDKVHITTTGEARPGDYATLTVRDTGCGMDEEILAHLFEPFFTTKPMDKGTGLGLSIVHGIVEQVGGLIDVVSKPGEGTSFVLYFAAHGKDVEHNGIAQCRPRT